MDSRPNILLFMTDHQRADSLFMEQCGREVTPNLNRLAREGITSNGETADSKYW